MANRYPERFSGSGTTRERLSTARCCLTLHRMTALRKTRVQKRFGKTVLPEQNCEAKQCNTRGLLIGVSVPSSSPAI